MNHRTRRNYVALTVCIGLVLTSVADATSNYAYKPDEYVTIVNGVSPDGRYSIATHGQDELCYTNFHIYLMDVKAGKRSVLLKRLEILSTVGQRLL